jgi:hypothetical protein
VQIACSSALIGISGSASRRSISSASAILSSASTRAMYSSVTVDELTSLLGRSAIGDELAELLEKIARVDRIVAIGAAG